MPQMMPLSWLLLYLFFCIMLLLFNFLNYYSIIHQPTTSTKKTINIKSLNWKW
uniref:ATP synthase F0 subunit 8 n=1 Tax=Haplosymploce aurantiaca TaxID=2163936 RepID=UPI0027AA155B|nr:ATP synthase F0 subunit 8 [Haplosymploce aurantiaca]WGO57122.1 ATP synthase F0 subunit 8 [Haplosymploce aurantiaca]